MPKSPSVHISIVLALLAIALPSHAQTRRAHATARVVTQVLPASGRAASVSAAGAAVSFAAGHPALVRVKLGEGVTPEALIGAGIDVVEIHGRHECVVLEWPDDEAALSALGASTEVLDPDPGRSAATRARAEIAAHPVPRGTRVLSATSPDGVFRVQTLPPFGSGSLGGFWTLAEVKMKLDQLVANDVNDVVADKLDTIGTTLQGRPIWGLRLGKSVVGPDTRPVAFFNSVTHAREPGGMQTVLYFADDLLAKYGSDPTATYLLDHRILYLVPVVNPDGYKMNEDYYFSHASTFGFHRKNLRDTNNNGIADYSTDGVDINRNYGFQWVGPGSSTTPSDDTYRGTAAFSEPETQAERDIVAALRPKTAISFHTYSDLYIHPWGYSENATPDSLKFYEWSDDMTLGNGYQAGQGPRILYAVNGEFTDWCYGETALKPSFFAWTPEVGAPTDGFWPPPSRMVPLATENLRPCYYAASIAGPYVRVERSDLIEGSLARGSVAHLILRARNKGASGQAGPGLIATLSAISAGAHVFQNSLSLPTLGSLQSGDPLDNGRFLVSADDTVTLGRILSFRVDFSAPDGFFSRDTIDVICGAAQTLLLDDASSGAGNWATSGGWGVESDDASHPGPFFADSRTGDHLYNKNADAAFTLASPLDLSKATHAYLLFENRWEFESDWDCGVVEASRPGVAWTPLAGTGTSRGTAMSGGTQPGGQPVYDGARRLWRSERVDLSPFAGPAGTAVSLRFRAVSDNGGNFDGFRLDAIRVLTFDPAAQPAPVAVGGGPAPRLLDLAAPSPNPARFFARLAFALPRAARVSLEVLDLQGRRVRTLAAGPLAAERYVFGWDLRDAAGRAVAPGLYLIRLSDGEGSLTRRIAVIR